MTRRRPTLVVSGPNWDGPRIAAETVFDLVSTRGVPLEAIEVWAEDRGWGIDYEGYHVLKQQHREVSRPRSMV